MNSYKNILILFYLCSEVMLAQAPIVKHFTTEDGLPHDICYEIEQDKEGYIWVGTDDGLTKFNGDQFINYGYNEGLRSNYVIALEIRKDSIIIGTWGGGLHYMYQNKIEPFFEAKDVNAKINKIGSLKDSQIYSNQNLNNFSVYNLKQKTISIFALEKKESHYKLNMDSYRGSFYPSTETVIDSTLWIHAGEKKAEKQSFVKGVHLYKNNKLIPILPSLKDKEISAVTKIEDTIYAITQNVLYTIVDQEIVSKNVLEFANYKIITIKKNKDDFYFLALNTRNEERELLSYKPIKNRLVNLSQQIGIQSFISDFMFDKDQNLWITTYGEGIYMLQNTKNKFFGKEIFKNADIKDIKFKENSLIILATNMLYALNNTKITEQKILPYHTEKFYIDKLKNEIKLYDPFLRNNKKATLGNHNLTYYSDKKFSFSNASFRVEKKNNQLFFYKNDLFLKTINFTSEIVDLTNHRDKIYVNLYKNGLYVYNYDGTLAKVLNKKHGFITNKINDFIFHKNDLWLATDRGLMVNRGEENKYFTVPDGLLSNHINRLYMDSHEVLWIGTQRGLNFMKEGEIHTINKSDGQKSSFITKILEKNDTIYIAGNKGLFVIDNQFPISPKKNSWLHIQQKGSTFFLNKLNFIHPKSLTLAYQLNNQAWTSTASDTLKFTSLKQGKYTIVFKYRDQNSNWTMSPSYSFDIKYAWYTQIWFYILWITLVAALLLLTTYKQLQKARNKNKTYQQTLKEGEQLRLELNNVRHHIAQDFHDDLGNKLASISLLSSLELKKAGNNNPSFKNIEQIQKDADELYNGMRDFIWYLDGSNNKLVEVQNYLNDFGEKLFQHSSITFLSTNTIQNPDMILPHYWNKQLILVFKEAMTNVLKHSKADLVTFEVDCNRGVLKIRLKDNGIGFEKASLKRINGLKNMQERIQSIDSKLTILSKNGVSISFKGILNHMQQSKNKEL